MCFPFHFNTICSPFVQNRSFPATTECISETVFNKVVVRNKSHSISLNIYFSYENDVNVLWHNRLGHAPFRKMREIHYVPDKSFLRQFFLCFICPMTRKERLSFPQRTTSSIEIFNFSM